MKIQPVRTFAASPPTLRAKIKTPKVPDRVTLSPRQKRWTTVALGGLAGAALGACYSWPAAAVGGACGLVAGWVLSRPGKDYSAQAKDRASLNSQASHDGLEAKQRDRSARLDPIPQPLGRADLIAVDRVAEVTRRYDGFDSSRDLFALSARLGNPDEPLRIQAELAHLRAGAERGHLDTRLTVSWDGGKLELPIKNDLEHGEGLNVYHAPELSCLLVELDKKRLRQEGWSTQPLTVSVSTGADELAGQVDQKLPPGSLEGVFRWEGRTIYYGVTDRFHNGDKTNDLGSDPSDPQRFHGGDWRGVIDKLDYLEGMGVDCLWLSCPYKNERDFLGMDGYHGYWPVDFETPEPSFGSLDDLKELCQKAHQKGMKVMLDVVLNHVSYNHPWTKDPNRGRWFHHEGKIWGRDQYAMEHGSLAGLPDLDQEVPEVADYLIKVHQDWMNKTGLDALRLDAVRHVPEPFLQRFNESMREGHQDYLSVGEAFWQDANFVAGYQNRTLDSMFDFRLAYAIRRVFASDPGRSDKERFALADEVQLDNDQEADRLRFSNGGESMKVISQALADDVYYDNPRKLSIFVDNHDMLRFMSDCGGDTRKLELALAFLYACRGMPTLYYGTEWAMTGAFPGNRGDIDWQTPPALAPLIAQLSETRHGSQALTLGTQKELLVTEDTYALARLRPDETVVALFNNADEPRTLKVPTGLPDGSVKNLLGGPAANVQDGSLAVTLPAKGYAFYQRLGVNNIL
ncbi:MAG: hypothetical protein KC910_25010 [Candidatus Eremiobacteraeota bacterium]|nr:hypothetical protein [Candidatus Eremiobacteraeota bacterium]